MDWSTVVILAAVTLLEGVRRVPADALVLRRVLGGQWTVADLGDDGRPWRLVSWWSPFTLALVVPSGGFPDSDATNEQTDEALGAHLTRARRVVGTLRLLGALIIVGIVFGIPAAIGRFGAWGFVAALSVVMLLTVATAIVVACAMRVRGRGWWRRVRIGAGLLWPFSAPRGAELMIERAVAGAPPLMVARQLLDPASFAAWVRPRAYDALRAHGGSHETASLLTVVGQPDLRAIVHAAPAHCGSGEAYCPRCARVYRAGVATCAECQGLHLVTAA